MNLPKTWTKFCDSINKISERGRIGRARPCILSIVCRQRARRFIVGKASSGGAAIAILQQMSTREAAQPDPALLIEDVEDEDQAPAAQSAQSHGALARSLWNKALLLWRDSLHGRLVRIEIDRNRQHALYRHAARSQVLRENASEAQAAVAVAERELKNAHRTTTTAAAITARYAELAEARHKYDSALKAQFDFETLANEMALEAPRHDLLNKQAREKGTGLSGMDLRGRNLEGLNFAGVTFKDTDLSDANIRFCDFSRADMTGCAPAGLDLGDLWVMLSAADTLPAAH